ncbi:hypothetical protein KA005_18790 [bacterium]|nr:hypothetical protein [bacterium]
MAEALTLSICRALGLDRTDRGPDYGRLMVYLDKFISGLGDIDRSKLDLAGTVDWTKYALESLNEVYEECSEANWDGYDAAPISLEAYSEASKLLRIIPNSFPMPDILPEPDGGIGLEWYKDRGFSFVISVHGKNIITYVGLFGINNETYGTEDFTDSVPKVLLNGLKRLFSNE